MVDPVSPWGGRVVNPLHPVDAWLHAVHERGDGVTSDPRGHEARVDACIVSVLMRAHIRCTRIDVGAFAERQAERPELT